MATSDPVGPAPMAAAATRDAPRVAFLGPMYTYSHAAAIASFGAANWVPLPSIAAVFDEVAAANVDFGLVPLNNASDGGIVETLTNFSRVSIKIRGQVHLPIRHCLLARGTRASIRRVASKSQALSQCRAWLTQHLPDAEWLEAASSAAAANEAAADESVAAIGSPEAARAYSLNVLAEDIQDDPNNVTRFAVLGTSIGNRTGNDQSALLIQPGPVAGDTGELISILDRHGLTVLGIESFEAEVADGPAGLYFVEIEGHAEDDHVCQALKSLAPRLARLQPLGSYPKNA